MAGILWLAPLTPIAVPARYGNTQAPHLTLDYGVERSQYDDIIGLPVTIALIGEAYNDEIQALRAILPNWLHCQNSIPHITVSWVNESAPVRSNLMLRSDHAEASFEAIAHCLIEFIAWEDKPIPRTWKANPLKQCSYVWMTGDRQGQQCESKTRRASGYCTKHRPQ